MTDTAAAGPRTAASTMTDMAKYELSRVPLARRCCRRAEAATMLRFAARVDLSADRALVEAEVATSPAAGRLQEAITKGFGYPARCDVLPGGTPDSGNRYLVRMTQDAAGLARLAGLIDSRGRLVRGLPRQLVTAICTATCDGEAAWRGAFLTDGTITERGGVPAIEITCPDTVVAYALEAAARRLGVRAQATDTRGTHRVVIKGRAPCAALLARLGAHQAAQAWDDMLRDAVSAGGGSAWSGGSITAMGNFRHANLSRSARAAVAAAAQAGRALEILGEDTPPHLAAVARLRIAHPRASLPELGQLADPPLSKDSAAGRIRRLLAMADRHAAARGIPGVRACPSAAAPAGTGARDHQ